MTRRHHEPWETNAYAVLWDGPATGRVEELPINAMAVIVDEPLTGRPIRYVAAGVVDERIRLFVLDTA